jgi:hypothetical protein
VAGPRFGAAVFNGFVCHVFECESRDTAGEIVAAIDKMFRKLAQTRHSMSHLAHGGAGIDPPTIFERVCTAASSEYM